MKKSTSHAKTCLVCNTLFHVPDSRAETAKYCSRACSDKKVHVKHTVRCRECSKEFPLKKSQERKSVWGNFCSTTCTTIARKRMSSGSNNPNWKGRLYDIDGYKVYTPQASLGFGLGKIKIHHAVAFTAFGIKKLPKHMHIHHKDCDIMNNGPENLQLINISDHKWIHRQYGSVTLNAIEHGKLDFQEAASWSDDSIRAEALLMANVNTQSALLNYFKSKNISIDISSIASLKPIRVSIEDVADFNEIEPAMHS